MQAMLLHAHIVSCREIVDTDNLVTLCEEGIGNFGADKTSRTSDEICAHQSLITFRLAFGTSLVALRASKISWALSTTML